MRLDTRGQRCPLPIIELARHIGDIDVGDTIVVVSDDPAAASDVAAWCRMRDHELVGTTPDGEASAYEVRRLH
jgi:tRNA 2-thiouridine synthesizing protein A